MNPVEHPRVSVVVPCLNAGRWIDATLDSIFAQREVPVEAVVVDDGSTDDSRERITAWSGRAAVRLLAPRHAGCAAAARNLGLAEARGEYIQFLDADDLLAPHKFSSSLAALAGRDDVLAAADWSRFRLDPAEVSWPADGTPSESTPASWLAREWQSGGGMLFPGRWLIPRALAQRAGPWAEQLNLLDDTEYFTRLISHARAIVDVPAARCYYRSAIDGSLSGRKDREAMRSGFAALELTEAHVRARIDDPAVRRGMSLCWQRFAQGVSLHSLDLADEAEARARTLDAVRLAPEGGRLFRLVAAIAGWRVARRLQRIRTGG